MDFKNINQKQSSESGYTFSVISPETGLADKKAKITVRGAMSDAVKAFNDEIQKSIATKTKAAKRRGEEYQPNQSDLDEILVQRCEATIINWEGFSFGGNEVPFPSEKASEILRNNEWLRAQILGNSMDEANFTMSLDKA